ncbi:MAG: hypothetical protein KGV45_00175 [Gammaproteobacteria bacterium]|nr:hypothetical protein [Gammaproteobacteria bacterium]
MNHIYKVVWCKSSQTFVAVPEFAKAQGKKSNKSKGLNSAYRTLNSDLGRLTLGVMTAMGIGSEAYGANLAPNDSIVVIGEGATATNVNSISIGKDAVSKSNDSVAVGKGSQATGISQSVAIGAGAKAPGDQATAIGGDAIATGNSSISIGGDDTDFLTGRKSGFDAEKVTLADGREYDVDKAFKKVTDASLDDYLNPTTGETETKRWFNTNSKGTGSIAIGVKSITSGALSTAVGIGSAVSKKGHFGIALGAGAKVNKEGAVALGAGSLTDKKAKYVPQVEIVSFDENGNIDPNATTTTTYDDFAGGKNINGDAGGDQVSVGKIGYERQIKNLAPGAINRDSTDAINGSQLFAITATQQGRLDRLEDKVADGRTYMHVNEGDFNPTQRKGDDVSNYGNFHAKAGATGLHSMTIGMGTKARSAEGIAFGHEAVAGTKKENIQKQLQKITDEKAIINGDENTAGSIANVDKQIADTQVIINDANATDEQKKSAEKDKKRLEKEKELIEKHKKFLDREGDLQAYLDSKVTDDVTTVKAHTLAFGTRTIALGESAIAVGRESFAKGDQSIAIGNQTTATGTKSISIGTGDVVTGNNAGAFGDPSIVNADNSYSFGNDNQIGEVNIDLATGLPDALDTNITDAFILGNQVKADVTNSVYLGKNSTASKGTRVGTKNRSVAVTDKNMTLNNGTTKTIKEYTFTEGKTTTAGDTGTVADATVNGITYGGFKGATADGVVTVGSAGKERRIQNVAAGEISETSTDAINGSQLHSVAKNLNWKIAPDDETAVGNGVHGGDQVNFKNGDATVASVVTDPNNANNYNVSYDVQYDDKTIKKVNDKLEVNIDNDSIKKKDDGTLYADIKGTKVVAGTNIVDTPKTDANGVDVYTINAKGTTVSKGSDKITVKSVDKADNITDYKIDLSGDTKKAIEAGKKHTIVKKGTNITSVDKTIENGADVYTINAKDTFVNQAELDGDNLKLTRNDNQELAVNLSKYAEKSREVVEAGSNRLEVTGNKAVGDDNRTFTVDLSQDTKDKIDKVDTLGNELDDLKNNTILLGGNKGITNTQKLSKKPIKFNIKGKDGLTSSASGDEVVVKLDQTTKDKLEEVNNKLEANDIHNITSTDLTFTNNGNLLNGDVKLSLKEGSVDRTALDPDLYDKLAKESRERVTTGAGLKVNNPAIGADDNNFHIELSDATKADLKAGKKHNTLVQGKGITVDGNGINGEGGIEYTVKVDDDTIKDLAKEKIDDEFRGTLTSNTLDVGGEGKSKLLDDITLEVKDGAISENKLNQDLQDKIAKKSRETVTVGDGLIVTPNPALANTDDQNFNIKLDFGDVDATNNNKAVTGKAVNDALTPIKTNVTQNTTDITALKNNTISLGDDKNTPTDTKTLSPDPIRFNIKSGDAGDGFIGTNLQTKADGDNILIGMTDKPTFSTVTADKMTVENVPDTADGKTVVNKNYVDANKSRETVTAGTGITVSPTTPLAPNTDNQDFVVALDQATQDKLAEVDNKLEKTDIKNITSNDRTITVSQPSLTDDNIDLSVTDGAITKDKLAQAVKDEIDEGKKHTSVIGSDNVTVTPQATPNADGGKIFKVEVNTLNTLDNNSTAPVSSTAVNTAIDAVKNTPITFFGDSGSETTKLNDNFRILSGDAGDGFIGTNLQTKVTNDQVVIGMTDKPTFNKTTVGNVITDSTTNKITGLADGTDDKDAVNVKQLNETKDELNQNITNNANDIDTLEKQKIRLTANTDETGYQSFGRNDPLEFAIKGETGSPITTEADGNEVTIKMKTSEIDNEDGKAKAKNADGIATAGDVADAINNAFWNTKAVTGVDGGDVTADNNQEINAGDRVDFSAGKNMKLVQDGTKYTYATKDVVEFTSAKVDTTDKDDDKSVVNVKA